MTRDFIMNNHRKKINNYLELPKTEDKKVKYKIVQLNLFCDPAFFPVDLLN